MTMVAYHVFETALGPCGIAWRNGRPSQPSPVVCFQLPEETVEQTSLRLAQRSQGEPARRPPADIAALVRRVQRHLQGDSQDFRDVPLDHSAAPPFHRRVYQAARRIASGQTRTYGQLAAAAGQPGAARAVGQALGKNPIALLVPCHRIVAAGGKPGGFSAHGRLTTKARLLAAEGAALVPTVTLRNTADVRRATARLRRADAQLAPHLDGRLTFTPQRTQSPYATLFEAVVHQQLSPKAAQTILGRVIAAAGTRGVPQPKRLVELSDAALRGAGLSRSKATALRDLAAKTLAGAVPTAQRIATLSDEEIIRRLTTIYGIGRWTVEMLLIFHLGRSDVWPVDDYALRRSLAEVYALPAVPTAKAAQAYGDAWRPYRTVASLHLWRRLNNT